MSLGPAVWPFYWQKTQCTSSYQWVSPTSNWSMSMNRALFCTRMDSGSLRCSTRTSLISWSKIWQMQKWVSIPIIPCSMWPPLIWSSLKRFITWKRLISRSSVQRKLASCILTQCSKWMLTFLNPQCQLKNLLGNLNLSLSSGPLSTVLAKPMEQEVSGPVMDKHLNSQWIVELKTFSMRQVVHPLWVQFPKTTTMGCLELADSAKSSTSTRINSLLIIMRTLKLTRKRLFMYRLSRNFRAKIS